MIYEKMTTFEGYDIRIKVSLQKDNSRHHFICEIDELDTQDITYANCTTSEEFQEQIEFSLNRSKSHIRKVISEIPFEEIKILEDLGFSIESKKLTE